MRGEEQDRALDSEAEVTEYYKKREVDLKKQFKDFSEDANRKVRLAEKRVAMFKNMYNKVKNEKLELIPIGNEKYMFLSGKDTLNMSMMSNVEGNDQEMSMVSKAECQQVEELVKRITVSEAESQQVEQLVKEITLLKQNVQRAEQEKEFLKSEPAPTHEIFELKKSLAELQQLLVDANLELEKSKAEMQHFSGIFENFNDREALANTKIHNLTAKIGESLAKRKLSAELNGSQVQNALPGMNQSQLLENMEDHVESLLQEYENSKKENTQLNEENLMISEKMSQLNTELLNNNLMNLNSESPELTESKSHVTALETRIAELE